MAVALVCAVGSWADGYTDFLNIANGYEEVTTIANMTSSDYYYVLAPAETTSLIVGIGAYEGKPNWASEDSKALRYKSALTNPITDATNFFILSAEDDGINMRNVGYNNTTYFQTHDNAGYMWVNTGEGSANGWTKLLPAYDSENGYWLFENGKYPVSSGNWACGYLGPWNKNVAAGEAIAANRKNVKDDWAGHYKVYRIKRTRYTKDVARNNPDVTSTYLTNPSFETDGNKSASNATLTITGWTESDPGGNSNTDLCDKTTANHSLYGTTVTPNDGTYYLFFRKGWNSGGNFTFTSNSMTLPAGVYSLSADYKMVEGYDNDNQKTGNTSVTLTFGDNTIEVKGATQRKGGDSTTDFVSGAWKSLTLDFTLETETSNSVVIKLTSGGVRRADFCIDNVRLIYSPLADSDDYAELSSAISTAESFTTFGFDDGEYAPYNVKPYLTAAQAINQEESNAYNIVRGLIESLNSITPNDGEVNAIFDGSFEHDYSGQTGNVQPLGWYRVKNTTDDGYHVRYVTKSSNAGVDYTSSDCALFTKLQAYYGWDSNYIMPLKANTYYTVSFIAGGAGDCDDLTNNIDIINPSEETTRIKTYTVPNKTANTDASSNSWMTVSATFKTGDAGNYVLGLVPRNSENKDQNQFLYGDISLVRATASEIKPFLAEEITVANATYNSGANVGTGVFQIPAAAGDAFNTAINTTAQGVYENASATADNVANAITNLKAAEEAYADATLNAPATGKRYNILMAKSGHANEGKAVVVSQGTSDSHNPTGYLMGTTALPADYLNQAFIFTSAEDEEHPNRYYISIERPEGTVYVTNGTTNGSDRGGDWGLSQIQGNTDSSKKLAFDIAATNVANVFNIVNTANGNKVAAQDGGSLYTENSNPAFSVAEATPASVSVNLAAGKYGTRIFPFVPSLPSEVKAYSCKAVDGSTLTLEEVTTPEANVPYIIYSEDGYTGAALTGYGTAAATSYTTGYLTGIYNTPTIEANANHYVLQTKDNGEQAFCIVTEDFTNTAPYRAYLTYEAPAGVKVLNFSFDDTPTAVNGIDVTQNEKATIYNLAGQRLNKAQKGVNIINGKKVLIK